VGGPPSKRSEELTLHLNSKKLRKQREKDLAFVSQEGHPLVVCCRNTYAESSHTDTERICYYYGTLSIFNHIF
jgi:hypothetical protein